MKLTQRQQEMRREWHNQKYTDTWIDKWRKSELKVKELEEENMLLKIGLSSIKNPEKIRSLGREEE